MTKIMQQDKRHFRIYLISQRDDFEQSLFDMLRGTGIQLVGNQSDIRMALWEIRTLSPDIIIMDFDNSGIDAFEIYSTVRRDINPDIRFLIVTDECNYDRIESAYTAGISYCMIRPCDMELLVEKIVLLINHIGLKNAENVLSREHSPSEERTVTDILFRIGVPEHCKGYALLKTAILYTVQDYSLTDSVMKRLYPMLAVKHGTSISCVERNIRNVIQIIWNRGDIDYLADIFGNTIRSRKGTPSNSQFIATIADMIRCSIIAATEN